MFLGSELLSSFWILEVVVSLSSESHQISLSILSQNYLDLIKVREPFDVRISYESLKIYLCREVEGEMVLENILKYII